MVIITVGGGTRPVLRSSLRGLMSLPTLLHLDRLVTRARVLAEQWWGLGGAQRHFDRATGRARATRSRLLRLVARPLLPGPLLPVGYQFGA